MLERSVVSQIVWLASYPKSGNTWVRFVITALLSGRDTFPDASTSMYANIDEFTPDVHYPDFSFDRYAARDRVFLKTHDRLDGGEPLTRSRSRIALSTASTNCAVYIVRNPLDIVTSTWNHLRLDNVDQATSFEEFFRDFSECGGHGQWTQLYGAWDENVDSWTSWPVAFPLLVLRYEDLVEDPVGGFRRIAEFVGLDSRRERIREVTGRFSFENLRRREDELVNRGVFNKKGAQQGYRFFNAGRRDSHSGALTAEQIRVVRNRFANTMARFGY